MNLDLLKKLVKLANNNPNENEANLAARKVCKIIEEAKFNFNNGNQFPSQSKEVEERLRRYASKDWVVKPTEYSEYKKQEADRQRYEKGAYYSYAYYDEIK